MRVQFFKCPKCGNVMLKVAGFTVTPYCCGVPMEEMVPNITEGKNEYHLPHITHHDAHSITVQIGKELHPMSPGHFIQYIYIETETGGMIHYFHSGDIPEKHFRLSERPIAVYAYCNLHGLWKVDL